ncbi:metal ABC transporter solute-binding protein, Zn/Mn family [Mycolicibacterium mengxianglii]|uniref:metal ABC transporter solute-binding protein, Zn/Mn family n=1 Tax=Mycolicibacterium mengxianglii TaxID=2736649 RepID=UPI0018D0B798|nr:zinc ABC transporter substrate-binding protein [Mycolicibacterium mengxianglii]
MVISTFRALAVGAALVAPMLLAGCSAGDQTAAEHDGGSCPVAPVDVVVSVDQWGGIVSQLGGDCAAVTTVLASSSVDPHDYEPAPSDAVTFEGAQLVVINGGHYDEWAAKLAATSAPQAPVIEAVRTDQVNPHAWYSPAAVHTVADAVTAQLKELAPGAADYFEAQNAAFAESLQPYDDAIDTIKSGAADKSYAATENVFDDMAAALGLTNRTPRGYQTSSAAEADPSPADLDAFLRLLDDKAVDVLIYNTQTEGSVPQQLRSAAESAGVPVVEVTETVAPGAETFEAWQVQQLEALAEALGVRD